MRLRLINKDNSSTQILKTENFGNEPSNLLELTNVDKPSNNSSKFGAVTDRQLIYHSEMVKMYYA
ncbi:hypothetical protein RI543_003663 [Arxiozyma heterogenica]|uniref:Uncharacterized protein n=1 Tax=Arxiozyma heterogenica TaxID=278026 RepID=A0AAN7WLS3_9SACH|nr:hypothetical protein RI543_003663 [Kazachstania heterogenica]